jgi:hypothetical protein
LKMFEAQPFTLGSFRLNRSNLKFWKQLLEMLF